MLAYGGLVLGQTQTYEGSGFTQVQFGIKVIMAPASTGTH